MPFAMKGEGAKAEAPTAAIATSATETLLRMLAGRFELGLLHDLNSFKPPGTLCHDRPGRYIFQACAEEKISLEIDGKQAVGDGPKILPAAVNFSGRLTGC